MNLNSSDRKKLLALPFFMNKRAELPEPRKGQPEYHLFTQLTNQKWYEDAFVDFDKEHKITEFDYENYFDPNLLKRNKALTESDDFKTLVKALNLFTYTDYEKLQQNKKEY